RPLPASPTRRSSDLTGNEVVEPGARLAPGQIFDVNRFTLAAIVSAHGGVAESHRAVPDTVADLAAALDACAGADGIVFSGGSSRSEEHTSELQSPDHL